MMYTCTYKSPLGNILIAADDIGLTGLWFEEQKYFAHGIDLSDSEEKENNILKETTKWLDLYFKGENPPFTPKLHPMGSEFRKQVWGILLTIPYGQTVTYGEIAAKLAASMGLSHMSAQAVGSEWATTGFPLLSPVTE